MDFVYIGEKDGCKYWHYITGKTTYVICCEALFLYRAFYFRNPGEEKYLLKEGIDCRINGFVSYYEACDACNAKLRALRGV